MTLRKVIISKLYTKPSGMLADHLNNRIKDYSWQEINEALAGLLRDEIIAVTNKRFWIRDNNRALNIVHDKVA